MLPPRASWLPSQRSPQRSHSSFLGLHFLIHKRRGRHLSSRLHFPKMTATISLTYMPCYSPTLAPPQHYVQAFVSLPLNLAETVSTHMQNGCGEAILCSFQSKVTKARQRISVTPCCEELGQPKRRETEAPQSLAQLSSS